MNQGNILLLVPVAPIEIIQFFLLQTVYLLSELVYLALQIRLLPVLHTTNLLFECMDLKHLLVQLRRHPTQLVHKLKA